MDSHYGYLVRYTHFLGEQYVCNILVKEVQKLHRIHFREYKVLLRNSSFITSLLHSVSWLSGQSSGSYDHSQKHTKSTIEKTIGVEIKHNNK